ncbi:UNVERIFIED_CONTAM: hypothetical protein PYX00_000102 [Menopon gallinae]|uniref:Uncharacterized protein n=1 Tax=Menopon gallinae TaxID=328185 RepID=A0AAW2I800_9NEOP
MGGPQRGAKCAARATNADPQKRARQWNPQSRNIIAYGAYKYQADRLRNHFARDGGLHIANVNTGGAISENVGTRWIMLALKREEFRCHSLRHTHYFPELENGRRQEFQRGAEISNCGNTRRAGFRPRDSGKGKCCREHWRTPAGHSRSESKLAVNSRSAGESPETGEVGRHPYDPPNNLGSEFVLVSQPRQPSSTPKYC